MAPPPVGPPGRPPWNGKTNGFAIAALTLSLFGCAIPLSTVFGIIAVVQTRNGDRRGRRFAIAALVINATLVTAFVVAVLVNMDWGPDRDAAGAIRGERSIAVADLRVGDCPKDLQEQVGSYVDVVPCSAPHTSEVFARFTLPDGAWAGEVQVSKAADDGCEKGFAAYTGAKPEATQRIVTLPPEAEDWPKKRDVTCMTYETGPTTGSLRR